MMCTPAKCDKDRKMSGFTLIELMLVLAVIGILAVVTVPKYQGLMDHYRLQAAAQKVVGQLRYAKQLAMDTRQTVSVLFSSTTVEVKDTHLSSLVQEDLSSDKVRVDTAASVGLVQIHDPADPSKVIGLGLSFDKQGFFLLANTGQSAGKIVLTSTQTGKSISVNIAVGTGMVTISQ